MELAEYHWSAGEYLRDSYCQAERWNALFDRREYRLWNVRHVQMLVLIVLNPPNVIFLSHFLGGFANGSASAEMFVKRALPPLDGADQAAQM